MCCFTVYFHKQLEHLAGSLFSSPALVQNAPCLYQLQHSADPCELIHLTDLAENSCILSWISFLSGGELYLFTGSPTNASVQGEKWECAAREGKGTFENSLMFVFRNDTLPILDLP